MPGTTSLTITSRTFELAELGPDSTLPSVQPLLESPYTVGAGIPADIAEGVRWGKVANLFPYAMQEEYSRQTHPRELTVVVLENEHLRAMFLPQLGGRLWELTDKATGKELVHTQEKIQFANLALRNAWFAGGIEFNIGTRGHSPTTCAPLHTAIVRTPDGQEVLRMWEFDRLREVVFQIDAWLPADSGVLFTAVRIRNPNENTVPMYWWTNAAIPQTAATRVLAPAAQAFATDYDGSMTRVNPTQVNGTDCTWPTRNTQAADFFFDIAPGERRWELAADDAGDGLALMSSPMLRGRKLFVWGESAGGHRWQEWLSPSDAGEPHRYAEIQSGLAQTQFEHVAMPAGAQWQWVEAYGNAALEPELAAGEWDAAVSHAADRIASLLPATELTAAEADAARWADLPPSELILAGNGWGALERQRRRQATMDWIDETGTPFGTETLTADQAPWLELLNANAGIVEKPFGASASEAPSRPFGGAASFVRGMDWEDLLTSGRNSSAEAAFHHAVMVHARASSSPADWGIVAQLYRTVLAAAATQTADVARLSTASRALAHRGLGLALLAAGEVADGVAQLAAACRVDPGHRGLLTEAATAAVETGRADVALELIQAAPAHLADLGRLQFLLARAHAQTGNNAAAATILRSGLLLADLREGANSISDLWLRVCPDEPVPDAYQFTMKQPESSNPPASSNPPG